MSEKKVYLLLNEKGFLSDDGKRFIKERFAKEAKMVLGFAENESEIRLLGSVLKTVIGNLVLDEISKNEK